MRAIIIANGQIENFDIVRKNLEPKDIIVCCDGGMKYAFEEGLMPHYIIGDLDSSLPQMVQFFEMSGVVFKKFPTKKDHTDLELALDFLIGLGVVEVLIFGAIGNRLDHTLANINLLLKPYLANVKATIFDNNNEITLIGNAQEFEITGEIGDLVSLQPLTTEVFVEYTLGLEYELKNSRLCVGSSLGVSNSIKSKECKIKIREGYLLIIKSKD